MSSLNILIGQLVKKYRNLKGYSTRTLARKLNVSNGFISNIENANTDTFKFDILIDIIRELDIPVDELKCLSNVHIILDNLSNTNTLNLSLPINNTLSIDDIREPLKMIIYSYIDLLSNYEETKQAANMLNTYMLSLFQLIKDNNKLK